MLTTDLERVLAEATAAGAKVPFKAPGAKWENTLNVEVAFTSAESLRAGLSEGAHGAISAALQGARAFSDADGWFESAFALATSDGGSSVLRRSTINALAASKDDRALEFLLESGEHEAWDELVTEHAAAIATSGRAHFESAQKRRNSVLTAMPRARTRDD